MPRSGDCSKSPMAPAISFLVVALAVMAEYVRLTDSARVSGGLTLRLNLTRHPAFAAGLVGLLPS